MSSMGLGTAYANVVDYGALVSTRSRAEEDANRGFIQAAINSGRHVLFPAGTYRFRGGVITFLNADQRCTFLAGAVLQPADSSSYVVVSGARQVLTGLRIETPADVAAHSPDDGDVAVALTELAFIRQVGGRFQPGPAVAANATVVRGLALLGCRMYGGAPPRFVAVSADLGASNPGGAIEGGVVMGCTFGVAVAATSGGEGQATSKAVAVAQGQAQSESDGDCIFEIKGSVTGLVVRGCYSAPDGLRASAWRIPAGAALSTCCDMFNNWAEADVALGDNQHLLPRMSTNELGRLTLTADEVRVDATDIGFFGAPPAASGVVTGRGGPAVRGDRALSARTAQLVLQQLVRDLVDLGLVHR